MAGESDSKTQIGKKGQTLTVNERGNRANTRNQGPEGNGDSPLKSSINNAGIVTDDKRKTGRVQ